MSGPLHGVTVVEMAAIGPCPFAAMLLADMGATVIRIDRPPGPRRPIDGYTGNDTLVDRGRNSVALDLKQPRGVTIALDIIAGADILVEGFRPGVMERLGLGPEPCRARNPALVYGRMTGWGQTGPLAKSAGHDLNYVALTGALRAMGDADRPPAPPLNLVGDYGGGALYLALGVVTALYEAARTGLGQVVDAAMVDGAASLMTMMYSLKSRGRWRPERQANVIDGGAHFYGTYECADGKYLALGAIEPHFYRELLERCGISDADFDAQWDEAQWPVLRARMAALLRTRTRDTWCEILEGTDACVAPVLDMDEAPAHPHMKARGTFVERGGVIQPGQAPRFERPAAPVSLAPQIGAHTVQVLRGLGLDDVEIDRLRSAGVIGALSR